MGGCLIASTLLILYTSTTVGRPPRRRRTTLSASGKVLFLFSYMFYLPPPSPSSLLFFSCQKGSKNRTPIHRGWEVRGRRREGAFPPTLKSLFVKKYISRRRFHFNCFFFKINFISSKQFSYHSTRIFEYFIKFWHPISKLWAYDFSKKSPNEH